MIINNKALTPDELKDELEPLPEIRALRDRNKTLVNTIDAIRAEDGKLAMLMNALTAAINPSAPAPNQYKPKAKKHSSPVIPVLHLTDWHMGANQMPDEIDNVNEFTPAIARDRVLEKLAPRFLDWVELMRSIYTINECVIPVTGDLISGNIHEELMITNEYPAPVQSIEAAYLLADLIQTLAPHFEKTRVEFIVADNHARLTKKPPAKEAGLNSFNYIVGHVANERLAHHDNIEFNIYPFLSQSIEVNNIRYLCCHGHQVRGWSGFPWYGAERMVAREALRRMNSPDFSKFSKVLMGHFHTPLRHPKYLIGGSLSGTDALDHRESRESTPCQTSWMVHPEHGEFAYMEWDLS